MEAVALIQNVETKTVKDGKTLYTVDAQVNGDSISLATFKQELGSAAGALKGKWATVEYKEVVKGDWTNRYLDAITEKPDETKAAAAESNDARQESIIRQSSWKQAAVLAQFLIPKVPDTGITPKQLFDKLAPLAHAIENDVRRTDEWADNPDNDGSVPF